MATVLRPQDHRIARCMRCETPTGLTLKEANDMDPGGIDSQVRYCVGCRDLSAPWDCQEVAHAQQEAGVFDSDVWINAGYEVTEDGEVIG